MAHTGIFATSDEILTKAGANYSALVTEARINALCLQAESYINVLTGTNWSDSFAGLNADWKGILSEAESNLVAIYVINYQMSGYASLEMASTMLDVLWARFDSCISIINKNRDKITT